MAFANPGISLVTEFDAYCKQLIFDIEQRFDELIERIRKRQFVLMDRLELLRFLGKEEIAKGDLEIQDIERIRTQFKQNTGQTDVEMMREDWFQDLDANIAKIRANYSEIRMNFSWEDNLLIQAIDNLGSIDMKAVPPKLENKGQMVKIPENPMPKFVPKKREEIEKEYPKMNVCKIGSKPGELRNPFGICIHDSTNNIYVADNDNNRIQVFNEVGIFLFKFGDAPGKCKLTNPYTVAIHRERVFVTEYRSACILTYEIDGTPILQIGAVTGAMKGYFSLLFSGKDFLSGLAFDKRTNGFLVCDNSSNSIHVFDYNFNFQHSFGSKVISQPRDIEVISTGFLVLDSGELCLHLFDFNFKLVRNFVSRGSGKDVVDPWFFCVDRDASIFMTDATNNCIYVINSRGEMTRQIGTKNSKELISPKGILIDRKGRLIVVDNKSKGCLQSF